MRGCKFITPPAEYASYLQGSNTKIFPKEYQQTQTALNQKVTGLGWTQVTDDMPIWPRTSDFCEGGDCSSWRLDLKGLLAIGFNDVIANRFGSDKVKKVDFRRLGNNPLSLLNDRETIETIKNLSEGRIKFLKPIIEEYLQVKDAPDPYLKVDREIKISGLANISSETEYQVEQCK